MSELFGIFRENRELKSALQQVNSEKQRMDAELQQKDAELAEKDRLIAAFERAQSDSRQREAVWEQEKSVLRQKSDNQCNVRLQKKEDFVEVVVGEATRLQDRAVKAGQLVATLLPLVDEGRIAVAKQSEQKRRKKKLTCSDCGNLVKNAKETVRQHVLAKHSEKPFECTKCGLKFALTANYKEHFIAKHDGDMSSLKKNLRELEPSVIETAAKFFPGHYWH